MTAVALVESRWHRGVDDLVVETFPAAFPYRVRVKFLTDVELARLFWNDARLRHVASTGALLHGFALTAAHPAVVVAELEELCAPIDRWFVRTAPHVRAAGVA